MIIIDKKDFQDKINRLLHIDGQTVRALEVLDRAERETLIKTLTWILTYIQEKHEID